IAAGDQCDLAFELAGGAVAVSAVARAGIEFGFEAGRALVLLGERRSRLLQRSRRELGGRTLRTLGFGLRPGLGGGVVHRCDCMRSPRRPRSPAGVSAKFPICAPASARRTAMRYCSQADAVRPVERPARELRAAAAQRSCADRYGCSVCSGMSGREGFYGPPPSAWQTRTR